MVNFPSLDPTTLRLPDAVRAQIAADLKDNTQTEGAAIAELLSARYKNAGAWTAGTAYALNDVVTVGTALFYCLTAHTAANPAPTASGNTYWAPLGASIGTVAGTAPDAAAIQTQFNGLVQVLVWSGTAWPASNPSAVARFFISTNDVNATTPVGLQAVDQWFKAS